MVQKHVLFVISNEPIHLPRGAAEAEHIIREKIELSPDTEKYGDWKIQQAAPDHIPGNPNLLIPGKGAHISGVIVDWITNIVHCMGYRSFKRKKEGTVKSLR